MMFVLKNHNVQSAKSKKIKTKNFKNTQMVQIHDTPYKIKLFVAIMRSVINFVCDLIV